MANEKFMFLSQLLPYEIHSKRNGNIRTGLKEYQALLMAFFEASKALKNLDLDKFDSLVGENACQIRAIWVAILASKGWVDTCNLKERIAHVLSKIETLLKPKTIDALMLSDETLKDVFTKENLDFPLTHHEMFLIQSYLLSEMKMVRASNARINSIFIFDVADPKGMKRFGDVTTSFADRLQSRLRKMLSIACVAFVRQASESLCKMVSHSFEREHNNLTCIPMFWTYKTILQAAHSANIPFVLHAKFLSKESNGFRIVREEYLFFKPSSNGSFEHTAPTPSDLNKPACVVQGIVAENQEGELLTNAQWIAAIKEKGLIDVILAGAADHRQYPNPALDTFIAELGDKEYQNYKSLAKDAGFSADNPTTFFIQHVYAARVGPLFERQPITMNLFACHKRNSVAQTRKKISPAAALALNELFRISDSKLAVL